MTLHRQIPKDYAEPYRIEAARHYTRQATVARILVALRGGEPLSRAAWGAMGLLIVIGLAVVL